MKFLLIATLSVFSFGAFSGEHWDKLSFEQQKQMKMQKIEEKSALLDQNRACIQEASDKEALKNCKEEKKDQKQAMEDKFDENKKEAQEEAKDAKQEAQEEYKETERETQEELNEINDDVE